MTTEIQVFPRISDYVSYYAERSPNKVALVLGDSRVTYSILLERVEELACALAAAGVRPGDRVATLSPPNPDYFVAFLATVSIGGIWLGLNPRYKTSELCYVVGDAEPSVLLTRTQIGDRCYQAEIDALLGAARSIRSVVSLGNDPLLDECESYSGFLARGKVIGQAALDTLRGGCGGRDACMIVYTSGSTGKPKGALLHHMGIIEMSRIQNAIWPVSDLRLLNFFPINHVGCVVDVSCPALVAGGTLVFMEQFDPRDALDILVREEITCWLSVPSTFEMQLALPDFDSYDFSAVELIGWEGAAMSPDTIKSLAKITPRLVTNYGMTETTSAMTIVAPTDDMDILANTVGLPAPGVELRLMGLDGKEVPEDKPGEIEARSPYNMLGYWKRPEATAETLQSDGWLRTGDTAVKRPDGRYRIVGRIKEMFKSGGYNVYPREIETVLETHPGVATAAVTGVPDPIWQEVGVAFVTASETLSDKDLALYCQSRLANYKVPKHFVIVKSLPLLPIGKIDKIHLREQWLAEHSSHTGQ